MSTTVIIFDAATGQALEASLRFDISQDDLLTVESEWSKLRLEAARRKARECPEAIPEHWRWDWSRKISRVHVLATPILGIEYDGKIQGLMALFLEGFNSRLDPDKGKSIVYVDYVEAAPWNAKVLTDNPRFNGIGSRLLEAAVKMSVEEGFHGRIGLHSLPQSRSFYENLGMVFVEVDPKKEDLPYMELQRHQVEHFLRRFD